VLRVFSLIGTGEFRGLVIAPLALAVEIAATLLLRIFHPAIFEGAL
jgi:hypothetical protein